jgi:hypothetical protein
MRHTWPWIPDIHGFIKDLRTRSIDTSPQYRQASPPYMIRPVLSLDFVVSCLLLHGAELQRHTQSMVCPKSSTNAPISRSLAGKETKQTEDRCTKPAFCLGWGSSVMTRQPDATTTHASVSARATEVAIRMG